MKVQLWEIWITEGMMGAIHGNFYPIKEFYFPELKMACNQAGFHRANENRYSRESLNEEERSLDPEYNEHLPKFLQESNLPDELAVMAKTLSDSIGVEETLGEALSELFKLDDSELLMPGNNEQ